MTYFWYPLEGESLANLHLAAMQWKWHKEAQICKKIKMLHHATSFIISK